MLDFESLTTPKPDLDSDPNFTPPARVLRPERAVTRTAVCPHPGDSYVLSRVAGGGLRLTCEECARAPASLAPEVTIQVAPDVRGIRVVFRHDETDSHGPRELKMVGANLGEALEGAREWAFGNSSTTLGAALREYLRQP